MDNARYFEFAVVIILIPTIAWLIKEVVSIRKDFVKFKSETDLRLANICKTCDDRKNWLLEMQDIINRTERNIVKLCQKSNVEYEEPSGR